MPLLIVITVEAEAATVLLNLLNVSHTSGTCQGNTPCSISETSHKGWVYFLPCEGELCKTASVSTAGSSSYRV